MGKRSGAAYLEHLDEADTERQVGDVGCDKRGGKEGADGKNVPVPTLTRHFHIRQAVEKVGVTGQDPGADCGESHVEGGEEDGVLEVEAGLIVEDVLQETQSVCSPNHTFEAAIHLVVDCCRRRRATA